MSKSDRTNASDQRVREVLYVGPSPDDDRRVVVTMELTCGCRVTQILREDRVSTSGGRSTVQGTVACPKGHPTPEWMHGQAANSLIRRALGRTG